MLVWGLIAAVCGVGNQILEPGTKGELHRSKRKALDALRLELEFGEDQISVAEAARIMATVLDDPAKAMQMLPKSPKT